MSACLVCSSVMRKLDEDVIETLEIVPRKWKLIQHVCKKFSGHFCEVVT